MYLQRKKNNKTITTTITNTLKYEREVKFLVRTFVFPYYFRFNISFDWLIHI